MKIYKAVGFIDSKRDSKRKNTITELWFNQKNLHLNIFIHWKKSTQT